MHMSLYRYQQIFFDWLKLLVFIGLVGGAGTDLLHAQEAVFLQHRWELEPAIDAQWIPVPVDLPKSVDFERLSSSVAENRLKEARLVTEYSDRLSEADREVAQTELLKLLREGESNRLVRLTQISAWSKLFDPAHAQEVWSLVENTPVVREHFERVLIDQKCDVAKASWLARLGDPQSGAKELILAIEGVTACGVQEARPALEQLVRSDAIFLPTRIVAARSLGVLVDNGLEELSREILASNRTAKEQLAASLLLMHDSQVAEQLISEILESNFLPAEVLAYRWYIDHRAEQAKQLAERMLKHSDSSMRLLAANVLHAYDDADSLRLQAQLLSDRNMTNRRTIRDHLINKAASAELLPVVDEILTQHLTGEAFEGIEQAILVVVALDEKERCPQLLLLLDHPRPEVNIRAAWALQAIAVEEAILVEIHTHCLAWTDKIASGYPAFKPTDVTRISFLFEAIGRNAYKPADEMLRRFVPKQSQKMQPITRTPAIWALGHIWEGRDDSGLEKELAARILDMSIVDPEDECVKYTCAVTLGMLGSKSSIAPLKSAPYGPTHPIGKAIAWALEQIGPE
jgi:hypothetical protein